MTFTFAMASLFVVLTVAAQENPAVVWWSAPVAPGELVQLHGGAWGTNPVVEVAGLANRSAKSPAAASNPDFRRAARVTPMKITDTGICFELPRSLEAGLAACRVVSGAGAASEPIVLNAPEAWWLQGDLGEAASPGGWLRLFGRCLDAGGLARVALVGADGGRTELALAKRDVWSLDAPLPPGLSCGTYTVFVHNGRGGQAGWRTAGALTVKPYREVWKADRFDVTDFGAIPNDGLDDTPALQAALAKAAANGGGTVYLPRGRFQCNGTLSIPERTLLRGESRETTELYWPDCEEPPENLIEGTSAFGIEDLFIHAGKYRNGIVCKNETSGKHELAGGSRIGEASTHDITLRRVRLKLIIDQYILKNTSEYEKRAYLHGNGLVVRDARFVRVEECDLYASKEGSSTLYFVLEADHLHIRNCRVNGSGWAVVGGDHVIFENNEAWNCTYSIAPVCRNLFWSGNRQHDLFTNNRESVTHDGARTAFPGLRRAACDGTRMTLDFGDKRPEYRHGPDYWVGREIQLVEGRGAGQTRTIEALTNNEVRIDRPWAIAPDATSQFVVASERRHLLYVDNDTEDSSIALQLYGGLTDGVLARNRCARSGGFLGFGMDYAGIIPLWFVQFLDNQIAEGNGYRGPNNEILPADSTMEICDHGNDLNLTRSCVIRRGLLCSNAHVSMNSANGVIEGCTVKKADLGLSVGEKHADSIVLRGNRFEQVVQPLSETASQRAVMHPAERVLTLLGGAETALGPRVPRAWEGIKKELAAALSDARIGDPSAAGAARRLLVQALRALSAAGGSSAVYDAAVAENLLGADVRIQSWDNGMTRLLASERGIEAGVRLQFGLAPTAPATSCAVAFDAIPGWTFPTNTLVSLAPGSTVTSEVRIASPDGAKGFFRLPATVTYRGEDWSLTVRTPLRTLTQNRICQWIVAAGPTWQALTNANVHGEMNIPALIPTATVGTTNTAAALLRIARPTSLKLEFFGPVRVTVDGTRVGADSPRGAWGNLSLEPGDHWLNVAYAPSQKGAQLFKVACDISDTCRPGDLTIPSASELLRTDKRP